MEECYIQWLHNLKDDDWNVRCSAVNAISCVSGRLQVLALIRLLEPEKWMVREAVASGLSCSTNEDVHAAVEESMKVFPWFMPYALRVLRTVGRIPAATSLKAGLSSDDPYLRRTALRGLGLSGNHESVPLLEKSLEDPDFAVRRTAATILGSVGNPSSLSTLSRHRDDPDRSVCYAVEIAIQRIRDR